MKKERERGCFADTKTVASITSHAAGYIDKEKEKTETSRLRKELEEAKRKYGRNNELTKKLEKTGCHVIYGLVGLKTHSKIALVVRKEEDGN